MLSTIEEFFKVHGDKRVGELRFMQSPWEIILMSMFYVYFSYDLGPRRIMKNRDPFDLLWTVRLFNTLILVLNVWLLSNFFSLHNWGLSCIGCAPVNMNDTSPKAMEEIRVSHIFVYSRILELIDTFWIVLRKKNRQITFLHVFHHSFVLLMTWFYFKLAPGGSSALFPIVNGTVHTIMYTYYILSLHFMIASLTPNCQYPRYLSITGAAIATMFFTLFAAFYKETYIEPKKQKQMRYDN